jgi:hypothetical protein
VKNWLEKRNCLGVDVSVFYLDSSGNVNYDRARAVCSGCPVKGICLDLAMEEEMPKWRFGYRGDMTPTERQVEFRRRYGDVRFHLGPEDHPHAGGREGTDRGFKAHKAKGEEPCEACVTGSRNERRASAQKRAAQLQGRGRAMMVNVKEDEVAFPKTKPFYAPGFHRGNHLVAAPKPRFM